MDVPEGYIRTERDGAVIVAREAALPALLEAGIADPVGLALRSPAPLAGRGRLGRIDLGALGRAIVRPVLRGGLLGKLVRRASLDRDRALSELVVSSEAAARGARVLDVLAAVTRKGALGWQHALVTREVEGARDLLAVLLSERRRPRHAALRAAGQAVRKLHLAGVDHVDLNVKNVLLAPDGAALVIDLDRCRLGPAPASDAVVEDNLMRLLRSWTKLGVQRAGSTSPRDPLRFLSAYAADDRALARHLLALGRAARWGCRRVVWSWARSNTK